jgi:serine/threonine protein kinase
MPESLGLPRLDGKYRLLQDVAAGSDGTRIWRAQTTAKEEVMVKILPLPPSKDALAKRRAYFADEIECGQVLRGEHVRAFLGSGEVKEAARFSYPNGLLYLVFEWIPYGSLRDRLNSGPLLGYEIRDLIQSIESGLTEAHGHQIRHRDLKPENILLPDGDCARAKVADFGIARAADGTQVTTTGWIGTWRYMAPEQFLSSSTVDERADIYSLALIVWETVSGDVPYDVGDAQMTIGERLKAKPLGELRRGGIELPALCDVLKLALARKPASRPESAALFASQLLDAGFQDDLWEDPEPPELDPIAEPVRSLRPNAIRVSTRSSAVPKPTRRARATRIKFNLVDYLRKQGLSVIDKRYAGGALWVFGGNQLRPVMELLARRGYPFTYKPDGGRTSGGRPAWWIA